MKPNLHLPEDSNSASSKMAPAFLLLELPIEQLEGASTALYVLARQLATSDEGEAIRYLAERLSTHTAEIRDYFSRLTDWGATHGGVVRLKG
jgi:hypothetical protein